MDIDGGEDVEIVAQADETFILWRERDAGAVLDSLYGAFSAGFMRAGRGNIEQEERDWSTPVRDEAA